MSYCTQCGTPGKPGSRFCTCCGNPLSTALPTPTSTIALPAPHNPRPRGRWVAVVTTLVLLLGGGGVTAWAMLTDNTDTRAFSGPSP